MAPRSRVIDRNRPLVLCIGLVPPRSKESFAAENFEDGCTGPRNGPLLAGSLQPARETRRFFVDLYGRFRWIGAGERLSCAKVAEQPG